MKRVFSPMFFVLAAAAFFLPFVTVSCNADALSGFTEGLGDLGGDTTGQIPKGNVDIVKATGWQIVTDSPDVNDELPSSGATQTADTGDLGTVQPFAIAAFALEVLGIFLSLLRGKTGSALAIAFGVGGAVALFLMKQKFEVGSGQAAALGLDISWKAGFWSSLGLLTAAGVTGLVTMLTTRGPGTEPVAAGGGFPSSPPPVAPPLSPPPTGESPPPVAPAAPPETPPSV